MVTYKQAKTTTELEQILTLQTLNLIENLDKGQQSKQGFLTVGHTLELLLEMNNTFPHTIAVEYDRVVGFALSMHPKFKYKIALLIPMFDKIEALVPKKNYMVMGQVCVAESHRGMGVFRGLYTAMKNFIQPDFHSIITEVNIKNKRSMAAHVAIGFKELQRYVADDGEEWSLISI